MNSRNKQQNDIMYNLNIEFGIHGIVNGDALIKVINEFLATSGDSVRVIGCSVRKPTARVDMRSLFNKVTDVTDEEIADAVSNMFTDYLNNLNKNINNYKQLEKNCQNSNEKEEAKNDKESD